MINNDLAQKIYEEIDRTARQDRESVASAYRGLGESVAKNPDGDHSALIAHARERAAEAKATQGLLVRVGNICDRAQAIK